MEVGREGGSREAWTNTHVCLVLCMFKANTRTTENYGERIFQHVTTKLILRESTLLYAMGGNKRIKIFSEKDWEMCLMELQNVSHKDLLILHKLLVLYNWINFRSTLLIGERERENSTCEIIQNWLNLFLTTFDIFFAIYWQINMHDINSLNSIGWN